jgi:hypothetical protein
MGCVLVSSVGFFFFSCVFFLFCFFAFAFALAVLLLLRSLTFSAYKSKVAFDFSLLPKI